MGRSNRTNTALPLAFAAGIALGSGAATALLSWMHRRGWRTRGPSAPMPSVSQASAPLPSTPGSPTRERQWIALHDIAHEFTISPTIQSAVQAIVESTVRTTDALGAYLERVETPGVEGIVEVVAVAGEGGPPLGTRVSYPGSLTEEIIESGEPGIMTEVGAIGERMAPYLHKSCLDCSGMIVPLTARDTVLGALVLLRSPDQPHFTSEDASYLRTLGDLAAGIFQRLFLRLELEGSEARFRQIADHLREVVWLASPDLSKWYYVNPAYERAWGRSLESVYAEPGSSFAAILPEDYAAVKSTFEGLNAGRSEIEYRIARPDGEVRWIRSRGYPVHNAQGEVYRVAGLSEDITEYKEAEAELSRALEREREAHEALSTILESIAESFYAIDRSWRITYMNQIAEQFSGIDRGEVLGQEVWEAFPEIRGTIVEREYRTAMSERQMIEFEHYYEPLDIWVNTRIYPAADGGISIFNLNVTERRRAEEELRESESNLSALANSVPQLVWIAEPDGRTVWYNERWYDFTGTTIEEMTGWGWLTIVHPEHSARVAAEFNRAFMAGEPWEDTYPVRSRTGKYHWFLSRAIPIRDTNGQLVRWFGTNTDITERVEADAERTRLLEREREAHARAEQSWAESERRREELERVTESRARLIRGFSHDVKNPLGAADGFLQLLEEGILNHLTEPQEESIAKARRSLGYALQLIDDLVAVARAQAGEISVAREPTDIRALEQTVAESYRAQVTAKGLTLNIELPETLPMIESDPARIRQILNNLLANAVKYTENGVITVTAMVCEITWGEEVGQAGETGPAIEPAPEDQSPSAPVTPATPATPTPAASPLLCRPPSPGRWVAISVIDTGPGIPIEKQPLLFQEFSRLTSASAVRGEGIGLFIAQKIAHALGGEITVSSEVGRGSTFTLWLPAEPPRAVYHAA